MKKKYTPYLIGIPNMGVGLLWAMNITLIPSLVGTVTDSNAKSALLISMGAFTGMFVQYLAGILSDRSNFKMGRRKPFIIIGSVGAAIMISAMPFAKTYGLLFLTAFIFYFSLNFYQGPYYSMIPESVEENQIGLANGFSKIVSVLGSAVIFISGPILWNKSHALPYFEAASLGLASVLITIFFIKENTDKYSKPSKLSFDFMKYPSVIKLYVSVFFVFLSYGCITPFFVKYCDKVLHLDNKTASIGMLVLTLSGALFAFPIGVLADKIEKRKVLMFGTFVFAIALMVATVVSSSGLLFMTLAVIGIGFISIQITIYSILAEIVPPERLGEFMGIINLFISLGQFLANNMMGNILDKYGFKLFFPISSGIMFVAAIIIILSKFNKYEKNV